VPENNHSATRAEPAPNSAGTLRRVAAGSLAQSCTNPYPETHPATRPNGAWPQPRPSRRIRTTPRRRPL